MDGGGRPRAREGVDVEGGVSRLGHVRPVQVEAHTQTPQKDSSCCLSDSDDFVGFSSALPAEGNYLVLYLGTK